MQYFIHSENVKLVGRTFLHQGVCWCGLSGSGIAFSFTGTYAAITFQGDDTTTGNCTEGKARAAVYVNDVRVADFMMEEPEKTVQLFSSEIPEYVEVKVVKLSECPMSVIGIKSIEVQAEGGIYPLPVSDRKIEFIGDSITCGFGVDMEDPEVPFRTDTEDVTKAYAYQTAQKLKADYSMVSYSGYGIISGYTEMDVPMKEQLVPTYYEKVGFSFGHPYGDIRLQDYKWDFSQYQPQLVIVNLGTNDDSYCNDDVKRQEEFAQEYAEFLKVIRKDNQEAKILCTVGIMGDRIYPAVEKAVKIFREQTGDIKVCAMRFPEQLEEDGRVSCGHPTAVTHEKAAELLTEHIRQIMNWQ
jgi:lysophospholipase L1-like esterase